MTLSRHDDAELPQPRRVTTTSRDRQYINHFGEMVPYWAAVLDLDPGPGEVSAIQEAIAAADRPR